ncbi:hypothetical protein HPB51_019017 [Rhipicephalus microplus]|uniref:Retrotransposon gag domain-containing protein n=1 Tax=Rhipicephalus microplus TaxID=6941 RepID=A0A9J6D6P0_RHIMP|nr:hypothetical protein HPB51_019017 [Rhipicephalus microplus]
MSALMLADMVPSFTGGDTGPDVVVFFKILEQVGRLGGWRDSEMVCIARCKMVGAAHDFAWWDDGVTAASTFSEFKYLALKRFDTEPLIFKTERFLNARQEADEDVRSFASRLRILGTATLASSDSQDPVPQDDEALPIGVADRELDENGFSEDTLVGVLVDIVVDRTLERVDEIEECLDRNVVVFVGPEGNCSTLDVHRTKPGHAQRWSYQIASHMPHSATELSRVKLGPSNEGPGLGVGEEVCMQVDAERSGIG